MSAVEQRLADLGLSVPEVAKPVAAYVPAVVSGDHVFTSGQLPMRGGELGSRRKPSTTNWSRSGSSWTVDAT